MCHIHKISQLSNPRGSIVYGSPNSTLNYIASRKSSIAFFAPTRTDRLWNPVTEPSYLFVASEYDGRPLGN